jgi:DNA-binding beta-propeller fold protein YncE
MRKRTWIAAMLFILSSLGCGLLQVGPETDVAIEATVLFPTSAPSKTLAPTATARMPSLTPEPTLTPAMPEPGGIDVAWRAGGEGMFSTLGGLDIKGDRVYVAAVYQGILVFDLWGNALGVISPDEIGYAVDVKAGPQGHLYLADNAYHRVWVFDAEGRPLGEFGGLGTGVGEFGPDGPGALAVNSEGEVFALDRGTDDGGRDITRVQVFDAEGQFLRDFVIAPEINAHAMAVGPDDTLLVVSPEGYIAELAPDDGRLLQRVGLEALQGALPQAISVDDSGTMYVTAQIPAAVVVLDRQGQFVAWMGEETVRTAEGWPAGEFLFPFGVAVTPDGDRVFVGDSYESFAYVTAFHRP